MIDCNQHDTINCIILWLPAHWFVITCCDINFNTVCVCVGLVWLTSNHMFGLGDLGINHHLCNLYQIALSKMWLLVLIGFLFKIIDR